MGNRDYERYRDDEHYRRGDGEHDDDRLYRGRESYEQQSRSGRGGRSGVWDHRNYPRDLDERYRNNADEDRRGYQNLGQRSEFESSRFARQRDDSPYRDYRGADDYNRYGFDAQDYGRNREWNAQYGQYGQYGFRFRDAEDDYSRSDYGNRSYGRHDYGGADYGARNYGAREYGRSEPRFDYGYGFRDSSSRERDFGHREPELGRDDRSSHDYRDYRDYGQAQSAPYSRRDDSSRYEYGPGYGRQNFGGTSFYPSYSGESYDRGRYQVENSNWREQRRNRGPKGYKRSDDRIREDVCDRLSQQWDLDASEVEVSVSNGEVTLSGLVNDRDQKYRVETIADGVGGVQEVHNNLRIRRETTSQAQPSATTPGTTTQRNAGSQSRHS